MVSLRIRVVVVTIIALAAAFAIRSERAALAQKESDVCVVPKAWGAYKGFATLYYAFEDAAGTIRLVDCTEGQATVQQEIQRQ